MGAWYHLAALAAVILHPLPAGGDPSCLNPRKVLKTHSPQQKEGLGVSERDPEALSIPRAKNLLLWRICFPTINGNVFIRKLCLTWTSVSLM